MGGGALTIDRRLLHRSERHATVELRHAGNCVVERAAALGGFDERRAARVSVEIADGETGAAADVARYCAATDADGEHDWLDEPRVEQGTVDAWVE